MASGVATVLGEEVGARDRDIDVVATDLILPRSASRQLVESRERGEQRSANATRIAFV